MRERERGGETEGIPPALPTCPPQHGAVAAWGRGRCGLPRRRIRAAARRRTDPDHRLRPAHLSAVFVCEPPGEALRRLLKRAIREAWASSDTQTASRRWIRQWLVDDSGQSGGEDSPSRAHPWDGLRLEGECRGAADDARRCTTGRRRGPGLRVCWWPSSSRSCSSNCANSELSQTCHSLGSCKVIVHCAHVDFSLSKWELLA